MNKTITVLVAGHAQKKLEDSIRKEMPDEGRSSAEVEVSPIAASLEKTLEDLGKTLEDLGKTENSKNAVTLRILTGLSDGTDQMAARIAVERKYSLHLLAAGRVDEMDEVQKNYADRAERVVLLGAPIEDGKLPSEAYAICDKTSLAFADMVVAVWDGNPPDSATGATAALILEAALMLKPVIWIDLAGQIRILNLSMLNTSFLQRLSLPLPYTWLKDGFTTLTSVNLEKTLGMLFSPLEKIDKQNGWMKLHYHPSRFDIIDRSELPSRSYDFFTALLSFNFVLSLSKFKNMLKFKKIECYWGPARPKPEEQKNHPISPPITVLEPAFKKADILATAAASWHRISQVFLYGLSAFAVFSAIAGNLEFAVQERWWSYAEAVMIAMIMIIYYLEGKRLSMHAKWTGNRFIAEQLRFSRMCLPLLILPKSFYQSAYSAKSENEVPSLENPEIWYLQRILIKEGIPSGNNQKIYIASEQVINTARYIGQVIKDQIQYHESTIAKNEELQKHLELISLVLFAITVVVIVFHPILDIDWFSKNAIFITAVFPAIGAAIHGLLTKLEIERTAKQSEKTKNILKSFQDNFPDSGDYPWKDGNEWIDWLRLRELSIKASKIMSTENFQWQELLRAQGTDLPG